MLDHLDLLDDTAPPDADAATLADVHARANGLRRRSRIASLGAVVAVVLVVAGVATLARNRDREVKVIAPSTAPTRTTEGTLSNGLHITMTLETPTVALGGAIEMSLEVSNDTTSVKTIGRDGDWQCMLQVGLVLRDTTGLDVAGDLRHFCEFVGRQIQPGENVHGPLSLSTKYVSLPAGDRTGRYRVGLVPRSRGSSEWIIPPLDVDLVAPDLSGHIEVSKTDFVAGDMVTGMLVIDNKSGVAIPYRAGCDWDVTLERNRVSFGMPQILTACYPQDGVKPTQLPVGITRVPFTVFLMYPGCSGRGTPTVDFPRCASDGSSPPLVAGTYQLVFHGFDAFESLGIPRHALEVR